MRHEFFTVPAPLRGGFPRRPGTGRPTRTALGGLALLAGPWAEAANHALILTVSAVGRAEQRETRQAVRPWSNRCSVTCAVGRDAGASAARA